MAIYNYVTLWRHFCA